MTLQLDLEPEVQAGLLAQAQAAGLTPEQSLDRILQAVAQNSMPVLAQNTEEWARSFLTWVQSHPTDAPLLSEEALSREFIYRERGL